MSRYLLDTNACIALMKENAGVVARIREVSMESLVLCAPVKAELWFGACKSQRVAENQDRLRQFFNDLPSLLSTTPRSSVTVRFVQRWPSRVSPSAHTICKSPQSPCPVISSLSPVTSTSSHESRALPSRTGNR